MREIKFRGKRVDNGEWTSGSLLRINSNIWHIFPHDEHCSSMNVGQFVGYLSKAVSKSTVGQYTGMHDRNGVEIYEGDIVRNAGYDEPCIVEYYQGQYIGRYKPLTKTFVLDESLKVTQQHDFSYIGLSFYVYERASITVIGNIHDNPELLGGTKC